MKTIILTLKEVISTPQSDFDHVVENYLNKYPSLEAVEEFGTCIYLTYVAIHHVAPPHDWMLADSIFDRAKGSELAREKIALATKNYQAKNT